MFAGKSEFKNLSNEFSHLKNQVDGLEEEIRLLRTSKKYKREKLAVELISKWATSLDISVSSTHKVVEHLGNTACDAIDEMRPLIISRDHRPDDRKNEKLLRISIGKTLNISNGQISLDEDSSAIMRWHITTYLNLLESIMVAWQRGLAQPEIIEEEFRFLHSESGNRFVLSVYRDQLIAKRGFDPYPAIGDFERKVSQDFKGYEQLRRNYLQSIQDRINTKISNNKSEQEAIKESVKEYLDDYRSKQNIQDRFDLVRFLASESAKAGFSVIAQKAFEILLTFLA